MKKIISTILVSAMAFSLVGCGTNAAAEKEANSASETTNDVEATSDDGETYNVGVIQLVQHPALDAATEGFTDALKEKLGDKVTVTVENASGDNATCATIANTFVSDNVDLIMANATPAMQACSTATSTIPIVATSITDYATALGIPVNEWDDATGVNVTGTSDLAPLDGQAEMLNELFPDAKEVGIIYCSGEDNSLFQANKITEYLEDYGYNVTDYTFSDSADVATVVQTACGSSDVLYVPTDNVAASCAETINNVAVTAGVPIIAGEEGICKGCGIATLSISYYDIGYNAGLMAYDILANGKDVATYKIQYATDFTKEYNPVIAETLGIELPDDYVAIKMDEE
ncbi:MAG: ABC transporter substrate-binding protein [Pseudobutyrivibrio sp.]|nr:ABC transporter substrate-binding protein [Pseudobutyrivibrio sp.]